VVDLWLYGTRLARIDFERRSRMRLSYAGEAMDRWGLGSRVFTVSQPLTPATLTPGPTAAIVEGLLPEGDALAVLMSEFGSKENLLFELGRETIGAVVAVPSDADPPPFDIDEKPAPLTESDIAARLRGLPTAPLGVSKETEVRLSLPGVQSKLPLGLVDGDYVDPSFSIPSAVILKPEPSAWPGLVDLESWGLAVLRAAGVPTPDWSIEVFEGIRTLVVHRYDREPDADLEHRRIHQEDLCMALGVRPGEKYATSHRSKTSLSHLASVVYENSATPEEDIQAFLTVLVVNVAIGNADAHARNLSLLHLPEGSVRLAPAYDVIPTYHYPGHSCHLAQPVDRDVLRPESVTGAHLRGEVESWGIPGMGVALDAAYGRVEHALETTDLPLSSPPLEELLGQYERLRP
jgi:serine/threonine-protein kinase HipA